MAVEPTDRSQASAVLDSKWNEVSSWQFTWRVSLWAVLLIGAAWGSSLREPLVVVASLLLLGATMAHGVELCHQALHHTGFRSPKLNEVMGVAMGLPMLVSFHEYRINHLKHHALLGTPANQEFFDYGSQTWTAKGLFLRIFMPQHYLAVVRNLGRYIRSSPIGQYHPKYQRQVRSFYLVVLLVLVALTLWCIAVSSFRPLATWLAALAIASPIHAWIEMPEHYGCEENSTDVFRNTRTIRSNVFMRWFTNSNNFHVEHHRWPSVPIQKIHQLHEICRPQSAHLNDGYWEFYLSAWRGRHQLANSSMA